MITPIREKGVPVDGTDYFRCAKGELHLLD
jgi:hypothetical protein